MDAERVIVATMLARALSAKEWPELRLKRGNRMTRETLDALRACEHVLEVKFFLQELDQFQYRVNSLRWHYFKYKYQYNDLLRNPDELNGRFEQVLLDPLAGVYIWNDERYLVYSNHWGRIALLDRNTGHRISVYRPSEDFLNQLGDPTWRIADLLP